MLEVCHDKIKKELHQSDFIALMADDTTDVSEHLQTVLVFRYELEGKVYERFWVFSILKAKEPQKFLNASLRN